MAITVNNIQSGTGSNATSLTISSYALPAGDNKILVVVTGWEATAAATVDSVTHDGDNLTKRADFTEGSSTNNRCTLWEKTKGSSTATSDVVVTFSGSVWNSSAAAFTLKDAEQQASEVTGGSNGASNPKNDSVSTVSDNALLIDAICTNDESSATTTQAGQTSHFNFTGGSHCLHSSSRTTTTAGSYAIGWNVSGSRMGHCVVAYKEAAAGPGPTPPRHAAVPQAVKRAAFF